MKILPVVLGLILLFALVISPAGALTARNLTIAVHENGDAQVDFSYDLNWLEQVAVYTKIADPGKELKSALEDNFRVTVDVTSVDNEEASVVVHSFATVRNTPDGTLYVTPELSFKNAQRALSHYWFAPLINADLSPEVTRIVFPDGYSQEFYNQIDIPSVSHTFR